MTGNPRTVFLNLTIFICLFSAILVSVWSYLIVIPYWDSFSIFDFDIVLTLPVFILSMISISTGGLAIQKIKVLNIARKRKIIPVFAMVLALLSMAFLLLPGVVFKVDSIVNPPDHTIVLQVSGPSDKTDTLLLEHTQQVISSRIRYYAEPFKTEVILPDKIALTIRKKGRLTKEKLQKILAPGHISFNLVHRDKMNILRKKNRVDFTPPEGYRLFINRSGAYFIKIQPEMTGNIKDATARTSASNQPFMLIEFKPEAVDLFANVTKENIGQRLAIMIDNHVRSVLVIRKTLRYGLLNITGDFTMEEAVDLSFALKSGPIPATVHMMEPQNYPEMPHGGKE